MNQLVDEVHSFLGTLPEETNTDRATMEMRAEQLWLRLGYSEERIRIGTKQPEADIPLSADRIIDGIGGSPKHVVAVGYNPEPALERWPGRRNEIRNMMRKWLEELLETTDAEQTISFSNALIVICDGRDVNGYLLHDLDREDTSAIVSKLAPESRKGGQTDLTEFRDPGRTTE